MHNYIKLDFTKVKGYKYLGPNAKQLFEKTYKKHNSSLGTAEKEKWLPVLVELKSGCLVVTFANGEWLHYYTDYTWG
ncbi:MAG: hypothetical protein N4A63_09560 [Vallitalea sp.]|nr:hypothetical protein [Vallitalea sp.]